MELLSELKSAIVPAVPIRPSISALIIVATPIVAIPRLAIPLTLMLSAVAVASVVTPVTLMPGTDIGLTPKVNVEPSP